jgi:hypothetical protein
MASGQPNNLSRHPGRIYRMDDKIVKYYQYDFNRGQDIPSIADHRLNMISLEQIYKIFKKIPILHAFSGRVTGGFAIYMILKNLKPTLAEKMITDAIVATEDIDIKFLMHSDEFINKHHNYTVEQFMLGSLKTDVKLSEELQVAQSVNEREMDSIYEIITDDAPEGSDIHKLQSTFVVDKDGPSLLKVIDGHNEYRIRIKQITAYINNKYFGIFNAVFTYKFDLLFLYPIYMKSHKYYYDYIGIAMETDDKRSFIQRHPRYLTADVYYDEYIDSEYVKADLVYTLCDALVKLQLIKYSNRIIKLTKIIGRLYLLYMPDKYEGEADSFKQLMHPFRDFIEVSQQYVTSVEYLRDKFNEVVKAHKKSTPQERQTAFDNLYKSEQYEQEHFAAQYFAEIIHKTIKKIMDQLLALDNFNQLFTYVYTRLLEDNINQSQSGGGMENLTEPVDPHNYKYYYNGINILKSIKIIDDKISIDDKKTDEQFSIKTIEKDKEYIKIYYLMDMILSSLIISGYIDFEVKNNKISLLVNELPDFKKSATSPNKNSPNIANTNTSQQLMKAFQDLIQQTQPLQTGGNRKTKRRYNRKYKVSKRKTNRKF